MRVRTISALLGLLVFSPFIIMGGGWFAFAMLVLSMIGLYEIARMKGIAYFNAIGIIASVAIASIVLPHQSSFETLQAANFQYLFYICGMLLLVLTVYQYQSFNFDDAATLMFGALYIGFGFRFLTLSRFMGLDTLMYLFVVIWATDIGAYLVGRQFGKNKLAPSVSPNKTVEGSLGGVVLAMLIGVIYVHFFKPNLGNTHHVWLLSIILSVVGQLGDLVESAIKRHYGVKDSGKLLPGHGGVLDRFDSLLFASFMFMTWLNLFRK